MKRILYSLSLLGLLLVLGCTKEGEVKPTNWNGNNNNNFTATSVTIKRIIVTAFPQTNNGSAWDPTNLGSNRNPDPYPRIMMGGSEQYRGQYWEDATQSDLPMRWTSDVRISKVNFDTRVDLDLYDYEVTTSDTWMGGYYISFSKWVGTYPKTVTISNSTSPYEFQLELEWN